MEVNIHQAKTHLSRLLRRTIGGEEVVIARAGVPIARLVPVKRQRAPIPLGLDRGAYEVPEDFDAPLPPEVIAAFEGEKLPAKKRSTPASRRRT
jgi:prevent-host-death family protein